MMIDDYERLVRFLDKYGISLTLESEYDQWTLLFLNTNNGKSLNIFLKNFFTSDTAFELHYFLRPYGITVIHVCDGFVFSGKSGTFSIRERGDKFEGFVGGDKVKLRYNKNFDVFMKNPMFYFDDPKDADYICEELEECFEDTDFLSVNDVIDILEGFAGTDILFDEYCKEDADYYGWYSSEAFWTEGFWTESPSGILHLESPKKLVSYEEEHKEIVFNEPVLPPKTLKAAAEKIIEWRNKMDNRVRQSVECVGTPRHSGKYPRLPKNQVDCCGGIPSVVRIDTYNNRVVLVRFYDGSFTKAVCAEGDTFNLDTGISICLMKRMISNDQKKATKIYNKMIQDAKNEEAARQKREAEFKEFNRQQKLKEQERQRKAKEKKARKQAEWRNNITEAIRPLMEHYEPDETDMDGGEE